MPHPMSDEKIVESWLTNAAPWIDAVRENQIESSRLVTNQAIVEAVLSRSPQSVLDIGCGEGWLVRALVQRSPRIRAIGVDAVASVRIGRPPVKAGGLLRLEFRESLAG